ncbi:asparagine synthase (glutamine-hydrolyzing) [Ginsengibacter hankyongi]|uniref:asparagine synthase (glutamine-hydrolyzing) n=1 Tax=Ginsengibacter hankyongi TaxID=2607284 RepID=A0A5J5IGA3_9BACT|nr:asparagine synthase (glutamine-hydrolyzing) [Ginsengibacter hankyongi]KAA9039300.1 asparagine synthase (glutamine-hydrolyzing) [Ginsengibacter hankyongi]
MCGFVGIINKNKQEIYSNILRKMADTIHHRGPDEDGIFLEGNIGFFHKRLSIIDLSTGQQPMTFINFTIVFNGEIYNYIELRNDLIKKGHEFRTTSDTEVILHLYGEYGDNFVNLLNGMFAFIIYDKTNEKLFIARDHFGIKPLYWYRDDSKIVFGSEIKALLAHPDIVAEADSENLQEYLTFQFILGEGTMFKNICKVQPGHYITIDLLSWKIDIIKYWIPNFNIDHYHTEEYFIAQLQKILDETISQQLRSDVEVGTYLSGGLDSSLVTIMAAKFLGKPFKSFSGAFHEGPEFNELKYARIAAKAAQSELLEIFPTEQEFIDLVPKLIYHLDEPVAGPGLFPQYIVSKLASKHVKVILGGQGGDEIFGGYARYMVAYLEQALKGAINESNEEDEHIVSLASILPNLPSLKQYLPMMKSFWKSDAFEPMDRRYYNLINRMGATSNFLHADVKSKCYDAAIFNKFSRYFNDPDTKSYFNKMTHFDMQGSLPGLLQVEDRVSMSVSIESRVPLLDRRIVDLISTMPAGMKFKGGEMKYLLKKTIHNYIPEQIMNRKDKMGFPVPLHIWSKNKAKGFIMDILLSKKAKERNIINTKYVEHLITSQQPFSRGLWGLLSLELWYTQFIDK